MQKKSQSTFIKGPSGQLEIRLTMAAIATESWGVVCHPHPQFGGTMDNKVVTTVEKAYQLQGKNTLVFQFRGVGQSEGNYDGGEGEQQDLAAVVNYCRQTYSVGKLSLAGFSFGAYIALMQAPSLQVDALLAIAPPVNLYDFSAVNLNEMPFRLIQGGEDEVVPPDEVLSWARNLSQMPDIYWRASASHFFHRQLIWLKNIILLED